jgi:hypothetical protein
LCDFNEITPSKLLGNKIKVKEKFCVVLVHSLHTTAQLSETQRFTELKWPRKKSEAISTHRRKFNAIAERFKISTQEDWYKINLSDLRKMGANGILDFYQDSLCTTLEAIYPGSYSAI